MILTEPISFSHLSMCRCTLACLMRCWLLKSFQRNTVIGARYLSSSILGFHYFCPLHRCSIYILLHYSSRIFFVTTVKEKGDLSFIGCTTNASPVVLTIPELSKLIRQIVLPQTKEGNILSFLVFA